ncbi:glycoside hydrolase family 5 protein, partial [Aquimarina agarilytica]|uniref:glycoside hydrolase family 5 protein n=1 Tax=Aquimarina agarilytica TaxID=1087449 RepID=UPI0002883DE6
MKKSIITLFSALLASSVALAQGVVSDNGLMKVDGNQIENKNGQPFSVAGNSIFWSGFQTVGGKFYRKDVVDHLAKNWKAGVVRAAMAVEEADGDGGVPPTSDRFPDARMVNPSGQGYFNNPAGELAKVKTIIDAAIANDIYVLVDFHSHFAHFYKDQAIEFFTEIARTYGTNDHIIYEIFNEPIGTARNRANNSDGAAFSEFDTTWNTIIRPYAIDVIKAIRAIDPDNLIIVGTPGFSQGVEAAADKPITKADLGFGASDELNIAYTLHFYANQPEHVALRGAAQRALDKGIALFVTEWGTVEASGDGAVSESETLAWMKFMKDNNISHANWSITDKFEGASVIKGNLGV